VILNNIKDNEILTAKCEIDQMIFRIDRSPQKENKASSLKLSRIRFFDEASIQKNNKFVFTEKMHH